MRLSFPNSLPAGRECKKELTEAVIAHLAAPPPDDVDVLSLGIAISPCTRCKDVRKNSFMSATPSLSQYHAFYRYPAVLGHPCNHDAYNFNETHNKDLEVYPTLSAMDPTEEADGSPLRYLF